MPEKKKKGTKKTGIAAKAESSGIPASILSQVYKRGIGAARTSGMRPNVKSPQQWAMARVNSILKGSKKHDTDIRSKAMKRKR